MSQRSSIDRPAASGGTYVAAQGGTGRPVVLFVMGSARSGTLALARVLSLCGGAFPAAGSGVMPDNPFGRWEPRAANIVNEKILRRNGSSGLDPTLRLQEEGTFDTAERTACIEDIQAFLGTLPAVSLVVIKDPRVTLLSGLWFEAAELAGFDVATVIAVREPTEVIASVAKRNSALPEVWNALWLKANLLAEAGTRDVPRVFVEHANLIEDWRGEMERVSLALGINLDTRHAGAIEEFLKPNLHHQRDSVPVTDLFGADWVSTVYGELSAAARDEALDRSALDGVFEGYRASERDFRAVFDGFQRLEKLNRNIRPSVMKMLYHARAVALARRGMQA
jgi:hypothetical protein